MLDELDVTPERAPATVLRNIWTELDPTSCWHWFKHNITAGWTEDYTIKFATVNNRRSIAFDLLVHPPRSNSLSYWLHQIHRPLLKALDDEEAGKIIKDRFGVELHITKDFVRSTAVSLPPEWTAIEEKALSANRKTILLIDDEARKMEDLFVPCMDSFHVIFASSAKDGLEKMQAAHIDLAIVDMQVPSGGMWHAHETADFKLTGLKLCEEIRARFPDTKIAILTGTRHQFTPPQLSLAFVVRKPIDPDELLKHVNAVLS